MKISLKIIHQSSFCLRVLLLNEFLTSCTPPVSRAFPPENYNGPVAADRESEGWEQGLHHVKAAPVLPVGYVVNARRIGDRRMILAGYRLADLLTRVVSN